MAPDFAPMLATLAVLPPKPERWAYEVKWDGVRAIVTVEGGRVSIAGRHGRDATAAYPELAALGAAVGVPMVLDGEIVAFDDAGRPSFEVLQSRMHVREPRRAAALAESVPVMLCVFDLLWIDGESLAALPYSKRRARLDALGLRGPHWQVPPASVGDPDPIVAHVRAVGLEGLVAKRLDSTYEAGRRSRAWLKVKYQRRQEFVVVGWTPGERGRAGRPGALALAVHDADGTLRYAGKVGTGFTSAELDRWAERLTPLTRDKTAVQAGAALPKPLHHVEPRFVVEVRFGEWTSVDVIRHATYLGWREDIDPSSVVREFADGL